jgi:hypothetical protein
LDEYGKDMTGINTGKEELWTGMMIGLANERDGKGIWEEADKGTKWIVQGNEERKRVREENTKYVVVHVNGMRLCL